MTQVKSQNGASWLNRIPAWVPVVVVLVGTVGWAHVLERRVTTLETTVASMEKSVAAIALDVREIKTTLRIYFEGKSPGDK